MTSDNTRTQDSLSSSFRKFLPAVIRNLIRQNRQYKNRRNRFRDNLNATDSFLVGHPKSGNTWTAYMLAIVENSDINHHINLSNIGEIVPVIHDRDFIIDTFSKLRSPRIFRNESPLYPELYPKTIYLIRDPRAALLSYYHHCVHDTGNRDWSMDDFVDEMLEVGCIKSLEPHLVRWDRQVRAWLDRRKSQPVEIVKYEDLKQDQHNTLIRMLDFLEIPHDRDLIDLAVQRSSFSSMRKEEEVYGSESFIGERGSKGYFIRKGEVDSWKSELPVNTIRKIENAFGETMEKAGY